MQFQAIRRYLSYILGLPGLVRQTLSQDALEVSLRQHLAVPRADPADHAPTLVVAAVEDPYFLGLFGQISISIRNIQALRTELFFLHSLSVGESESFAKYINARFVAFLNAIKWRRLYRSFADGTAYRSTAAKPFGDVLDYFRAWNIWRQLRTKSQLVGMRIDGIPVGDLVNDSYLRFKPSAELIVGDRYLRTVIWQAFRDIRRARAYFGSGRAKLLLISYATYVQHGIAVRAAMEHGARVYTFGNYQEFAKRLESTDWVHTKNPLNYSTRFETLAEKPSKLAFARRALTERISGKVDSATAYMRASAYSESNGDVPDVSGALVIFLHDFFDSPHVYYDMLFSDFWDWICFTIEALEANGIRYFIKPHPNHIPLSDDVLRRLLALYPNTSVIPQSVTNRQLATAGMRCGVTVYGTVAHELAFLGIPSISCARHPHISFSFCRTATSRQEYVAALIQAGTTDFNADVAQEESLIFFHMHNRDLSDEELELRDTAQEFRALCARGDAAPDDVVEKLRQIESLSAFRNFVADCAEVMQKPSAAAERAAVSPNDPISPAS